VEEKNRTSKRLVCYNSVAARLSGRSLGVVPSMLQTFKNDNSLTENCMITQKELKETLHYNPKTGIFTRLFSINQVESGSVAGGINGGGYLRVSIKGVRYNCHNLAWLYVYGVQPKYEIDHVNHIKTDNRIENLRDVTHQENNKNQSLNINNKSGFNGVDKHKSSGKWRARIPFNGKEVHLGLFGDLKDAIDCRKAADIKYGYHENHGKNE